jgi:hypothetical protein
MRTIAQLLSMRFAAPMILAGTLALAVGGAAALNSDNDHDGHRGCEFTSTQAMPAMSVSDTCWWGHNDRDGN